jgi:hypothetical protein
VFLFVQTLADSLAFGFISGLAQQGKHVFLVGLNSGLVKGIYTEQQTAQAAGALKEIDELTQTMGVKTGHADNQIGNSSVNVGQTCSQFCHFVDFVNVAAFQEVESVEVLLVMRENQFCFGLFNGYYRLKNSTSAF